MKKEFIMVAIAIVAIFLVPGCAGDGPHAIPEEPEGRFAQPNPLWGVGVKPDGIPYNFIHVCPFLGFDWMECFKGISNSLIERSGASVVVNNASGNLEAQQAAFDDAIVRKPDAIFLSAIESPPFEDYIRRAVDAGIPVFDYDHVTNNALIQCSVTHDQVKCGEEAGKWLVDYANATGRHLYVYEIWGAMAQDGAQKRHEGYQNAFRNQPLITVLESPDTGWASEKAMNAVLDAFPTHPELNAICSQYDMTAGITEALRTIGKLYPVGHPNHIQIVVMDEEPLVMQHLREGLIDGAAAHGPWEEADPLVKAMLLNVCLGEDVPKNILISTYMVTKDNMDSPRWEAPMIWGDMMTHQPDYDKWPILDTSEIGIRTPSVK